VSDLLLPHPLPPWSRKFDAFQSRLDTIHMSSPFLGPFIVQYFSCTFQFKMSVQFGTVQQPTARDVVQMKWRHWLADIQEQLTSFSCPFVLRHFSAQFWLLTSPENEPQEHTHGGRKQAYILNTGNCLQFQNSITLLVITQLRISVDEHEAFSALGYVPSSTALLNFIQSCLMKSWISRLWRRVVW
jgi:hypothetical protein